MGDAIVGKVCGRALTEGDLEAIRGAAREADPPLRAEIARRVCEALRWYDTEGRPELMSARVGFAEAASSRGDRASATAQWQRQRARIGAAVERLASV